MKTMMLLMLAPAALLAQAGNWNVLREIDPGKSVHIHMLDGHKNSGSFVSTTVSTITIRQGNGEQTFPKEQIRKIRVRKSGRLRNIAIGAGIGGATSAGIFAARGSSDEFAGILAQLTVIGTLGGAAIGAFVPGYDTVY